MGNQKVVDLHNIDQCIVCSECGGSNCKIFFIEDIPFVEYEHWKGLIEIICVDCNTFLIAEIRLGNEIDPAYWIKQNG